MRWDHNAVRKRTMQAQIYTQGFEGDNVINFAAILLAKYTVFMGNM